MTCRVEREVEVSNLSASLELMVNNEGLSISLVCTRQFVNDLPDSRVG